jgi:hypothetical protein
MMSLKYPDEIAAMQLKDMEHAKLSALMKAYKDVHISTKKDGFIACQYKIDTQILNTNLVAYVDEAYEDCFVEHKLSFRPDFYLQKENVAYQLGSYFIANESWEYAIVKAVRVPAQRLKDGESFEAYEERIYGDILSRPGFYFLGWDRKTRTYGTRFWRTEFDLDEIYSTYCHVLREIRETVERGSWYPNYLACHVPAPCPYLPIKRSGVVSEEIYERRIKKGGETK